MMTLEEAIEHCKEVAKESREAALSYARENAYETAISCKAVGYEHEQIAEWLIELKQRREAENSEKPKTNGDRIRQMTDKELADWITDGHDLCDLCQFSKCVPDFGCEIGILGWLRKECEENDKT